MPENFLDFIANVTVRSIRLDTRAYCDSKVNDIKSVLEGGLDDSYAYWIVSLIVQEEYAQVYLKCVYLC